jgi:hypothetical protein
MSNQEIKENEAVDFSNPEALEAELAAAEAATPAAEKPKKPAKPKVIKVKFVADKDYKAGDEIEFDYEVPKGMGTRGAVAGIPLDEMTDDQLKIEYRNANSVFYKAKKANKNQDTITKSETRLEACKAEMEKRGIQPTARGAQEVDAEGIAKLIMAGKVSVEDIQAMLNAAAAEQK